jgi:hypothetical protein
LKSRDLQKKVLQKKDSLREKSPFPEKSNATNTLNPVGLRLKYYRFLKKEFPFRLLEYIESLNHMNGYYQIENRDCVSVNRPGISSNFRFDSKSFKHPGYNDYGQN